VTFDPPSKRAVELEVPVSDIARYVGFGRL